jgi:hypothetical protein
MKKLICLFGFSSLFLASCSSDSSSSGSDDVLVTKSVENDVLGGGSLTTTYAYNGKKIVSETDSDGALTTFTYTGDLITQVKYYESDHTLYETETFTYNSSNKLIGYVRAEIVDDLGYRQAYVYNSDGTVSFASYSGDATSQDADETTGTIHLSGGEVTMIVSGSGTNTVTHTYTYDTKNTPFMNVTGFDKIAFVDSEAVGTHHNILTDHYVDISDNYTYNSTYTYNSQDYPLTWVEMEGTDSTSAITTTYTYN